MPRGTDIAVCRAMLKAEIGYNLSEGTGDDANLNYLLHNMQQSLADTNDWPFLEKRFDVSCPVNSRYLNMPAVNTARPMIVEIFYNRIYYSLGYGITNEQFNYRNSDLVQVQDPIQRWKMYDSNQFEIWPINQTGQTIRFTGQRQLSAFTTDGDLCDLDDLMLVLFTAGEYALRNKWPDAQLKQQRAQERYRQIRAAYPTTERRVIFGKGYNDMTEVKIRPLVITAGP